jgi:hypothetical protein
MKRLEIRLESKELLGFSQVEKVSTGSASVEPASLGRVLSKMGVGEGTISATDAGAELLKGPKVAGS